MPEILAWFAVATALITGVTVLGVAFRKIAGYVRIIVGGINDILGEPARPGYPGRAGMLERLLQIDGKLDTQGEQLLEHGKQLADIHHELHPNSGKSSRDILDRLDRAAGNVHAVGTTTTTVITDDAHHPHPDSAAA